MNSFAVFKSRTNYTDSLSIDNCDVHRWVIYLIDLWIAFVLG